MSGVDPKSLEDASLGLNQLKRLLELIGDATMGDAQTSEQVMGCARLAGHLSEDLYALIEGAKLGT